MKPQTVFTQDCKCMSCSKDHTYHMHPARRGDGDVTFARVRTATGNQAAGHAACCSYRQQANACSIWQQYIHHNYVCSMTMSAHLHCMETNKVRLLFVLDDDQINQEEHDQRHVAVDVIQGGVVVDPCLEDVWNSKYADEVGKENQAVYPGYDVEDGSETALPIFCSVFFCRGCSSCPSTSLLCLYHGLQGSHLLDFLVGQLLFIGQTATIADT